MQCRSCDAYVGANDPFCPSCGIFVNEAAMQKQLEKSRKQSEQLDRIAQQRESDLKALGRAKAPARQDAVGRLTSGSSDWDNPSAWNELGILRVAPSAKSAQPLLDNPTPASMRRALKKLGLDPNVSLEDVITMIEEMQIGMDLWTSPKRFGATKFRCVLYVNTVYRRLERISATQAETAWSAVVAALIYAHEHDEIDLKRN